MNKDMRSAVAAAALIFAAAAAAFGQSDDPKTAPPAQGTDGSQQKPPSPIPTPNDPSQKEPGTEPVIKVSLRDGVHFKSDDGNFDIIIGGYVGIHYRWMADRPNEPPNPPAATPARTSPDTWFVRQARPEISGFIYKDFDFRLQMDFPTSGAVGNATTGTLQDCYAGWRHWSWLSLRVGQFKEPFGQEQTTPDRYLDFDERSQGDKFTPQRDIGAEAYGTLGGGFFTYELGWFNGQGRSVVDANKGKEEAGRLRLQPFATADEGFFLKYFRLGVAGTLASNEKSPVTAFNSTSAYLNINYLTVTTPVPATNVLDGERTRWGGEATWNYGPVGLRGEAWRRVDHANTATLYHARIPTDAWSAQATWLLSGEFKPIDGRVLPTKPFDPGTGEWGAFELAARVDRLHIGDEIFSTGIAPAAGQANAVTGYSAGLNWYLTRNIRISPDFFWEVFNRDIAFTAAGGKQDRHFFGGILRFQLEF
jgi:phosphate-selective porin OprO/OprP